MQVYIATPRTWQNKIFLIRPLDLKLRHGFLQIRLDGS
jgi:hypothetical protein